jgi:hypothetical protein
MNRWRVGEDRGSKETDRCPLTPLHSKSDVVLVGELGVVLVGELGVVLVGELGMVLVG